MRPPSLNLRPRGTGTHIVRNGDVAGGDRAAPELAMVDCTDHLAVKTVRLEGADDGDDAGGGLLMTGRTRLPGGEMRKASQKRSRPATASAAVAVPAIILSAGDRVRWSRHTGLVQRVVGDQADVRQDGRNTLWRLPVAELTRMLG